MIRLILTFTLLALAGTSAAQTLRQTDENVTSDRYQGQTMKPLAQFTIEGRVTQVKCEFTGRTTALCTCNEEPNKAHEDACLTVLRNTEGCGRVQNGEAICEVDPK